MESTEPQQSSHLNLCSDTTMSHPGNSEHVMAGDGISDAWTHNPWHAGMRRTKHKFTILWTLMHKWDLYNPNSCQECMLWLILTMMSFPEISAWCMLFIAHPGSSPAPWDLFMQFIQMQASLNDIWPPAINQLTCIPIWNQKKCMTYTHRHIHSWFSAYNHTYMNTRYLTLWPTLQNPN